VTKHGVDEHVRRADREKHVNRKKDEETLEELAKKRHKDYFHISPINMLKEIPESRTTSAANSTAASPKRGPSGTSKQDDLFKEVSALLSLQTDPTAQQ
jgi:hypothetical protein